MTENIATRISLSGMLYIEGFIWDGRKIQLVTFDKVGLDYSAPKNKD